MRLPVCRIRWSITSSLSTIKLNSPGVFIARLVWPRGELLDSCIFILSIAYLTHRQYRIQISNFHRCIYWRKSGTQDTDIRRLQKYLLNLSVSVPSAMWDAQRVKEFREGRRCVQPSGLDHCGTSFIRSRCLYYGGYRSFPSKEFTRFIRRAQRSALGIYGNGCSSTQRIIQSLHVTPEL